MAGEGWLVVGGLRKSIFFVLVLLTRFSTAA